MQKNYYAHLTLKSENEKTGKIPVSVTTRAACASDCALRDNGCYAETGPMSLHWRAVTQGDRGMGWEMFCDAVATLPPMQLWRHNAAGDLPGDGRHIDRDALGMLTSAQFGKRGFTYTHYRPDNANNRAAIIDANIAGFTVNLSANNLAEADALFDAGIAPVVTVVARGQRTNLVTPKGRMVVICPAETREDVTCATCQLCSRTHRDTIVGFPAHGSGASKAEKVFHLISQPA